MKLLLALAFIIALFLAINLLSVDKNKDLEVRGFIGGIEKVTNQISDAISDPSKPDFEKAQKILDENKEELKTMYKSFREGKDIEVDFSTQTDFDKSLDKIAQKIVTDIPEKYLEQVDRDLEELKEAKKQYELKKDKKSLQARVQKLEKFKQDGELLEKVQNIVDGYKSMMQ